MRLGLNKAHFPVTALGPGRRAGIWVQGCSVHCAGCVSRDTWDPEAAGDVDVNELVRWVAGLPPDLLDGVTISGGEPFDQPDALQALLRELDSLRRGREEPIDVLAYSGYGLDKLRTRHSPALRLLDAVIAGPYKRARPTRLIWRGSANQSLVPLTRLGRERYAKYVGLEPPRPPFQVSVDDGVWLIGVPQSGDMPRLESLLQRSGVHLKGVSWRA